jgi:hypothetical protein
MISFLEPAQDRPVIAGLQEHEIIIALDQPQYIPLRTLQFAIEGQPEVKRVFSRWTLTPEQRQAVANGDDILIDQLTFGRGVTPLRVIVGTPDQKDLPILV